MKITFSRVSKTASLALLLAMILPNASYADSSARSAYVPEPISYTLPDTPDNLGELLNSAFEFNPATIALCNLGFGDVEVTSYLAVAIGEASLFCGDAYSGYVHIRSQHGSQWQQVVDMAGGGMNWDDLMDFATKSALWVPSPDYPVNVGDGKYCYTTPILIKNSQGQVIKSMSPTVIVSVNNRKVITSIPTTTPSC